MEVGLIRDVMTKRSGVTVAEPLGAVSLQDHLDGAKVVPDRW